MSLNTLIFRYGAVSSAKTLNLLAVAHSYKVQGKNAFLLKPALDTRFGNDEVKSRAGLSQKADFLIAKTTNILDLPMPDNLPHCLLVDEVQFFEEDQIDQLRLASDSWNIPVICYGLRTDFRSHFFPGSRRLMEIADVIEEIETTCHYCAKKAVLNLKHVNGVADTCGPSVQLGAEEKYFPVCFSCYRGQLNQAKQSPVDVWSAAPIRKSMNVQFNMIRRNNNTKG